MSKDLITTSVEQRDGVTVLNVVGDVDMVSVPVLERAIADVLADGPVPLVIDMSAVRFLSASGLAILVETREKVVTAAGFAVVARRTEPGRVIRLLKLDKFLSLQETVEDALAAVVAAGAQMRGGSGSLRP